MKTPIHHTVPLFTEERKAGAPARYKMSLATSQHATRRITESEMYAVITEATKELRKIAVNFNLRRDEEFPGWRDVLMKGGMN